MLKAIVSFSKKVPVPDSEYSSQGYHLSLETEIPETEPQAIQARLHDTFELVKSSVEQELANGNGARPASTVQHCNAPGPNGNGAATNRQIKFITDLAGRQGVAIDALNARIRERFNVDGLYSLDKKQASTLLDEMKNSEQRQAA